MPFAEDPSVFMDDADEVVFNGDTALAWLDEPDEEVLQGRAQSTTYALRMLSSAFPMLKHGDTVRMGDSRYTVHTVAKIEDGAFKRVVMFKA
jgi:hypothetical protein